MRKMIKTSKDLNRKSMIKRHYQVKQHRGNKQLIMNKHTVI